MHIDSVEDKSVALFIFAHQDDEFGVFHLIEAGRSLGKRPVCIYFTRGNQHFGTRRNEESGRVLVKLGVHPQDIVFAGDQLGIDDAMLHASIEPASAWLEQILKSLGAIESIHVTAWEGGHHDHDVLHALTLRVADGLGLLSRVRQFSLYNRYRRPGPFFNVLTPLAANGPVESRSIPLKRRLAYLRLCLQYPTQWKTWIGLFPFVLLHHMLRGSQATQPVSLARLAERPHEGMLYYEYRKFYSWERMRECLSRSSNS